MRGVINGFSNASMDLLDRMETAAHAAIQFFITERVDNGLNVQERVPAEDSSAKEVTYYTSITLA